MTFTSTATDADGDALTYTWDLNGDGTFETTGQNPTFTYTTAGTYTPVVKVTDAKGGSTTKTLPAITVAAEPGTSVPVVITGSVPTVLGLSLSATSGDLGTFQPGVRRTTPPRSTPP